MKKAILAVLLAAICTVLFYGIRYIKSPLMSIEAKKIVFEQSIKTDAIFVRDEAVYTADMPGTLYNHYSEGERIKTGALITTIYNGSVDDEIMLELRTIDKKIKNVQTNEAYQNIYNTNKSSEENVINEYKTKIIEAGENGDALAVSAYKDAVNSARTGEAARTVSEILDELEYQKFLIENKIGVEKYDVYAQESGVFTTVFDGLENYLTPESAYNMTVSDFSAIRVNDAEAVGKAVNEGNNVCKVSNNHEWYVLICVDAKDMEDYDIGDRVNMRFSNIPGEQTECKILNKSEEQDGKIVVLLVSNYYLEGAYSFRHSEATVIFKSYTGYKVPIHAIRTEENVQGIIAEKQNNQKFYPCRIVYTDADEGFAIVDDYDEQNTLMGIERIVVGER